MSRAMQSNPIVGEHSFSLIVLGPNSSVQKQYLNLKAFCYFASIEARRFHVVIFSYYLKSIWMKNLTLFKYVKNLLATSSMR